MKWHRKLNEDLSSSKKNSYSIKSQSLSITSTEVDKKAKLA